MLSFITCTAISLVIGTLVSIYFWQELRKSGRLAIMPPKIAKALYITTGILFGLLSYFLLDILILVSTFIKGGFYW